MPELQTLNTSNVNALALIVLVIVSFIVLLARPRYAVAGLLLTALFIPLGQQFVIGGLHFRFFRVLIIVGFVRLIFRRSGPGLNWTLLDGLIIMLAVVRLICGLWRGAKPEMFGAAYDLVGTYFIFRMLMSDTRDIVWLLRVLATASVLMALCMSWELLTTRNVFFVFGGVPEFTYVREGRFRCQGPFRHPILAGTFVATLFPMLVGVWQSERRKRSLVLAGIMSCVVATYIAASSGALLTLLTAIAGLAMWRIRERMPLIRWITILVIVELAILMHAPIWYLIAKVSSVAGGTGWHRAYIIDQAVEHFDEWWVVGSSYTAHWAQNPYTILDIDPDNMDITNHYILQGLQGGLAGLGLFLGLVACCFKMVGRSLKSVSTALPSSAVFGESGLPDRRSENLSRIYVGNDRSHPNGTGGVNPSGRTFVAPLRSGERGEISPRLIWAIGVSFASHCAAFISVSYFDQILVFWIWLVAVIAAVPRSVLTDVVRHAKGRQVLPHSVAGMTEAGPV